MCRYHFKLHWKTHEGEKCYKCDECDYAACSQRHLESHILTHSGEKPFECDECDHAFRQKQLLRRHKNHHHTSDYQPPMPRDKSHDCSACDKSYAHKGNLMRHMAQHGGDLSEDDTTSAASGEGTLLLFVPHDCRTKLAAFREIGCCCLYHMSVIQNQLLLGKVGCGLYHMTVSRNWLLLGKGGCCGLSHAA